MFDFLLSKYFFSPRTHKKGAHHIKKKKRGIRYSYKAIKAAIYMKGRPKDNRNYD